MHPNFFHFKRALLVLASSLFIAFSAFSFFTWWQLTQLPRAPEVITQELNPVLDQLYEWNQLNTRIVRSLNLLFTAYTMKDLKTVDSVLKSLKGNISEIQLLLDKAEQEAWKSPHLKDYQARWFELQKQEADFMKLFQQLVQNLSQEAKPSAWEQHFQQLFSSEAVEKRSQWLVLGYDLLSAVRRVAQQQSQLSLEQEQQARWLQWISVFLLPGFVVMVFVLFYRYVRRIGSQLYDQMLSSLKQMRPASQQLQQASQGLSQNTSEAAASLEETVASVEEVSSLIQLGSERAREGQSIAKQNQVLAAQGLHMMAELNQRMRELSEHTRKIQGVTSLMNDISFQVQLLALNASVESARAGEQGKGFALVAEAVQALSQKSNAAVKDIEGLILSSVKRIQAGHHLSQKLHQAFARLSSQVEKLYEFNQNMSQLTSVQSQTLSEMSRDLNSIDQAVQNNAASSEELAAAGEQLLSQVQEVASGLERLRLALNLDLKKEGDHDFKSAA